jgi:hypothetical protein
MMFLCATTSYVSVIYLMASASSRGRVSVNNTTDSASSRGRASVNNTRDSASSRGRASVNNAKDPQTHRQSRKRESILAASACASTSTAGPLKDNPSYVFLGAANLVCEFCGALFWFNERRLATPVNSHPRYTRCCKGGTVSLPLPAATPEPILSLYKDADFMSNIRAYNSMFAMTSFGASIVESIDLGHGPYVFKVAGQVSHWIGSLCPTDGIGPRFLQMYVYDTDNEFTNRLGQFTSTSATTLSTDTVETLTSTLDSCNELVRLIRTARDLCKNTTVTDFAIRIYQGGMRSVYDAPLPGTLGAIVSDIDPMATTFDIIVHNKSGPPKRISKLHSSYMSLQYPLIFPLGQQGWSPDLRLTVDSSIVERRLTMNMFYCYQLHDRSGVYSLLLNSGRLFQQYLVDAYVCIEQNRLDYIRSNQDALRGEFLSGIHDAFSKGETEGRSVGRRIILPSSFTGSPRYMYKHYQDALAICRVHGNPQYFITFTCNVKWPEITEHYSEGCLSRNKSHDRPDIIARVFKMKVDAFVRYLRTERPFGDVAAGKGPHLVFCIRYG